MTLVLMAEIWNDRAETRGKMTCPDWISWRGHQHLSPPVSVLPVTYTSVTSLSFLQLHQGIFLFFLSFFLIQPLKAIIDSDVSFFPTLAVCYCHGARWEPLENGDAYGDLGGSVIEHLPSVLGGA